MNPTHQPAQGGHPPHGGGNPSHGGGPKKGGPSPKDSMKNRLPVEEMKQPIADFLSAQRQIHLAVNNDTPFPDLEVTEFRFHQGKCIIILTPASIFLTKLEDGSQFTGFIFDKEGHGLKMTKRAYGKFVGTLLGEEDPLLRSLAEDDGMISHMIAHKGKFLLLDAEEFTVFFSPSEVFAMDKEMNPSFAPFEPNGKPRYPHIHHVLMSYQDREVIFNTIQEDGVYYTLTKAESNKMSYLKEGGVCQFFDGRDRHFSSAMTILPEEKVKEIFDKLVAANHAYFKSTDGLVALSFQI